MMKKVVSLLVCPVRDHAMIIILINTSKREATSVRDTIRKLSTDTTDVLSNGTEPISSTGSVRHIACIRCIVCVIGILA